MTFYFSRHTMGDGRKVFGMLVALAALVMLPGRAMRAGAATTTAAATTMPALQVIPQPREVRAGEGAGFDASKARAIVVSDDPGDRFAARLLQQSVRETRGVECDVVLVPAVGGTGSHRLWIGEAAGGAKLQASTVPGDAPALGTPVSAAQASTTPALSAPASSASASTRVATSDLATPASASNTPPSTSQASTELSTTAPFELEAQGYSLSITSAGAAIESAGDAGLFYGVQTLIQMLEQSQRDNSAVAAVSIVDSPTFGLRCRYFDASQYAGTIVNTRGGLEREIKQLARYKLNALVIDLYNLVPFKSFPYCADANTLSSGDWEYLVELAHRYHVTIIPSLQSFAQMYQVIWTCDEGKPYREGPAGGLICPSRPENIAFLRGLYKDLITTFKYSPILGIGCSEVGMQWADHYCPLCKARIDKGESMQDIFTSHVRDCIAAVDSAAKEVGRPVRAMMWGDEYYMGYGGKRWVDIEKIPTSTVMGHWMYWKPYSGIAGLLERGYDVLFLSATYQHNIYLADLSPEDPTDGKWEALIDSGIRNVADQALEAAAEQAKRSSGKGPRGKVIGGGCATFSQHDLRSWDTTWFAYLLEAEYSWGRPGALSEELNPFIDRFAAVYYDARDPLAAQVIASAYRELDAVKSDFERNNYLIRDFIGVFDVQDKSYNDNDLEASLKLIDELAAHPPGAGKTIEDIRKRCEHALEVLGPIQQKLAAITPRVQNVISLDYLASAPRKMKTHAHRTLFLLDVADALRALQAAKDDAGRAAALHRTAELRTRCDALRDETRLLLDETDELTHGARLNKDGVDSSGYAKALGSLEKIDARLRDAK